MPASKFDCQVSKGRLVGSCKWCCIFCIIIYLSALIFELTLNGLKFAWIKLLIKKISHFCHPPSQESLVFYFQSILEKMIYIKKSTKEF